VHDRGVLLDVPEVVDGDGTGLAHPAEVVASQVDEHEVLGVLLLVGEQLLLEQLVLLESRTTWTRTGDREGRDTAVLDLDQ